VKDGLSDHEGLAPAPAPAMVTPLFAASRPGRRRSWRQFWAAPMTRRDMSASPRTSERLTARNSSTRQAARSSATQASQSFALLSGSPPSGARDRRFWPRSSMRSAARDHLDSPPHLRHEVHARCAVARGSRRCGLRLVGQKTCPSWGFMLENRDEPSGNTGIQRQHVLHNHPMFGSVSEWFLSLAGRIQPAPEAGGLRSHHRPAAGGEGSRLVKCRYGIDSRNHCQQLGVARATD